MKVYILAAHDNIPFAEKLLEDIKDISILSKPSADNISRDVGSVIKKKIALADVVLAIIDEKLVDNLSINTELRLALLSAKENIKQILIPVVLNEAALPTDLEGMVYIKCNSKSEEDLYKAKLKIDRMLCFRKSEIRKSKLTDTRSRTSSMIILTLAIEMFAMFFIAILFESKIFGGSFGNEDIIIFTMLLGLVISFAFGTLLTSYFSIMKRRHHEDNEEEIESYSRRLKRAIVLEDVKNESQSNYESEEKKKEIDALGRMMINLEDIKEFYTWSQKQAKASFVLAVSMCVLGFVLMIIAIVLPIIFSLSFQMSIIPAVGGIITELIAGTALVVYRNSLVQLNHYHKALHEDERFLSSVNLLGKFSTVESQDDMLREIIRSEIQMNLFGLSDAEKMKANALKKEEKSKYQVYIVEKTHLQNI